jgi:hypothetical protein
VGGNAQFSGRLPQHCPAVAKFPRDCTSPGLAMTRQQRRLKPENIVPPLQSFSVSFQVAVLLLV